MLRSPVPPEGVVTMIRIVLSPAGEVLDVAIQQSSGHPALDAEGQRAARAAGPFPEPPPGLADPTTAFTFRLHFQP